METELSSIGSPRICPVNGWEGRPQLCDSGTAGELPGQDRRACRDGGAAVQKLTKQVVQHDGRGAGHPWVQQVLAQLPRSCNVGCFPCRAALSATLEYAAAAAWGH
eukprot:366575-Chlamydomonas_euryale.AAC.9